MSALVTDTPTQEMTSSGSFDYGGHFLLSSDIRPEIKNEPPVEIDDSHSMYDDKNENPKIRLTPTSKLMAMPNFLDPKRKFVCPYENCTKSYGKSSHLRSHLTWHTGIKPFVCHEPNCGKGFTRSDELNRHVRTHTGEKPFECIQCTKKFSRSDHLTKHLATHAKQMQRQPLSKSSAGTTVETEEESNVKKVLLDLQRPGSHMNYSESMHFMTALLDGQSALKVPENLTNEPTIDHAPIKIKLERPEHSDEYHVVSSTATQLHHINTSESEDEPPLPPEVIMPISSLVTPPTPPEIKADINDDVIMPEANAALPQSPDTSQSGSVDGNGNGFLHQNFSNFVAEVTYDPERPFRCEQCSKCFRRQDDLNRHARTHTGEKPFKCSECDRRFMRSDHLKKHMNTHTKLLNSCKQIVEKARTQPPV